MEAVLIIVYSALFLTFVYRSKIFHTPSLSPSVWVSLAASKIFLALVYNWLHFQIPTFFDSYYYFSEANIVFSALQENPLYYLQLLLLPNNYFPEPEHLCEYIDRMGLWYDWTGYSIVRINAFFRLFSFGFVSVHFVLFSFLSFIGAFYLYKFFSYTTTLSEYLIAGIIFFIPSVAFWTSGLHKEALVLFTVGIVVYNTYHLTLKLSKWRLFLAALFFLLLINIRLYMLVILLPALIGYYWNEKSKIKAFIPYLVTYGVLLFGVVLYDIFSDNTLRLAYKISEYQRTFLSSAGNTSFEAEYVSNSWRKIFLNFPDHFSSSFIYPLYNQCVSDWCRLVSVLSMIFSGFIVVSLFRIKYKYVFNHSLALFCLSIGFSLMTVIGVVVNNGGAISRYRSIAVLFLIIGFVLSAQKQSKAQL